MPEDHHRLRLGSAPILVSMPHVGTGIPPEIAAGMTPTASRRDDTDWHLEELHDFLDALGASVLVPTASRYVVDLNRPSDGRSLYPGQDTTPICPLDTFDREPLYQPGCEPSADDVARRVRDWWEPYHAAIEGELVRMKAEHGIALLWDAHSVRSVVPRFFEGRLPDINIGTVHGRSCGPGLGERLLAIAQQSPDHTAVLNGRFVGGHVTRAHGKPEQGVHAVQLELSQITYMDESPPYALDPARAARVRPVLQAMIAEALAWTLKHRPS